MTWRGSWYGADCGPFGLSSVSGYIADGQPWGVHRDYDGWRITHLPSGRALPDVYRTRRDAYAVVERIAATGRDYGRAKLGRDAIRAIKEAMQ